MTQHTPGPWELVKQEDDFEIKHKVYFIGSVYDFNQFPENEANARLIAAAPDLLEALEYMIEEATSGQFSNPSEEEIQKARAAIAKAKGETK